MRCPARLRVLPSGRRSAIPYRQNHWPKLKLFLRVPGAPLDAGACGWARKKASLRRKNALLHWTLAGQLPAAGCRAKAGREIGRAHV